MTEHLQFEPHTGHVDGLGITDAIESHAPEAHSADASAHGAPGTTDPGTVEIQHKLDTLSQLLGQFKPALDLTPAHDDRLGAQLLTPAPSATPVPSAPSGISPSTPANQPVGEQVAHEMDKALKGGKMSVDDYATTASNISAEDHQARMDMIRNWHG